MNAVILAGGFGSRLSPLTDNLSKPMLQVANVPMIDYAVSHLWSIGIRDYIFTLNYRPEDIIEWCIGYRGAVSRFSLESEPLGTLGGVKAVEEFLQDVFIVASGDVIENINLDAMLHKHFASNADITMAVSEAADVSRFGVPELDAWGRVIGFIEKPLARQSGFVNTGIYIVNKCVLADVPQDIKLDFAKDLFPTLAAKGTLYAYTHDGYWQDAGTLASYYHVNFDLLKGGFFNPAPNRFRTQSRLTATSEAFDLMSNSVAQSDSLIAAAAAVHGEVSRSIVGHESFVAAHACITDCILLPGARVAAHHHGAIIGKGFTLPVKTSYDTQPSQMHQPFYPNF